MDHLEIDKLFSLLMKEHSIKDCFHHKKEECRLPIKSAHSLQRQGVLKILESEVNSNQALYDHTERIYNDEEKFLNLKPIGRKKASTFFGFCSWHDTELFKAIENEPENTNIDSDEHLFLHAYRAFAHSYHRKYEHHKLLTSKGEKIQQGLRKIYTADSLEQQKRGAELSLKDLVEPKQKLDKLIELKKYGGLSYLAYEFPYTVPLACSGIASPYYSFSGKYIFPDEDVITADSDVITTVLPFSNRTVVILAVFEDSKNGNLYLDEIDQIKYELIKQKFLSFHIINHLENCFLSPKFFDSKTVQWKRQYCALLDHVANNETPILTFQKSFPFNYFDLKVALL